MTNQIIPELQSELRHSKTITFIKERIITSPQRCSHQNRRSGEVINFCANNYLGLSSHLK